MCPQEVGLTGWGADMQEDFDIRWPEGRYIRHRPRDTYCISVSSESGTETDMMPDSDLRAALVQL